MYKAAARLVQIQHDAVSGLGTGLDALRQKAAAIEAAFGEVGSQASELGTGCYAG
jgi:hypothetical protein